MTILRGMGPDPLSIDNILKNLPSVPPRQDSVTSQVQDLLRVATRLGMYDAADLIVEILKERGIQR